MVEPLRPFHAAQPVGIDEKVVEPNACEYGTLCAVGFVCPHTLPPHITIPTHNTPATRPELLKPKPAAARTARTTDEKRSIFFIRIEVEKRWRTESKRGMPCSKEQGANTRPRTGKRHGIRNKNKVRKNAPAAAVPKGPGDSARRRPHILHSRDDNGCKRIKEKQDKRTARGVKGGYGSGY